MHKRVVQAGRGSTDRAELAGRDDPAVRHHEMVREYDHPEVGRLRVVGQPLVFADTPTRDPGPPPLLGQHTDQILGEAGYDAGAIAGLREKKVVR